jgi:hypothetical protein
MTLDEALERVRKLAERRREKAQAYSDAAAEYEARALSADEVLSAVQRDFLVSLGVNAQRSSRAMCEDADALCILLVTATQAGGDPREAREVERHEREHDR